MSALLVYKIVWLNFLYFHFFESHPAKFIPPIFVFLVCASGLLTLALHKFDTRNYVLIFHKMIFVLSSFFLYAIDNRTTVALFESAIVVFYLTKSPIGFPLKQAFLWLLGLTFFLAGFHKLNMVHLFGAGSCSIMLAERGLSLFQLSSQYSLHLVAPWIVVASELLVPFFLVFRWYRTALMLVSTILLAFTLLNYSNFTALLLVLTVPLFYMVPERRFKNLVLVPWLTCFAIIAFLQAGNPLLLRLLDGIIIIFILANAKMQIGFTTGSRTEKIFVRFAAALFLLNGMSVYLGYKNQGVLSMYSNLQVYGSQSNHLLIKQPLALSRNLSDLVTIVASDVSIHKDLIGNDSFIPLKLLKLHAKYLLESPNVPNIIFQFQGREHSLKTREDYMDFTADLSFIDTHFLILGYVRPTQTECRW